MRILFSHFYNEEYLLPWWLDHHRQMFDHGILIDYGSTDHSVEICKRLVPGWEIIKSENPTFEAILCDFEVMNHEARFRDAWKMALNTTEFLISPMLEKLESFLEEKKSSAGILEAAVMADDAPEQAPEQSRSLIQQKGFGVWESDFLAKNLKLKAHKIRSRSRVYHKYRIGAYEPGRHTSQIPGKVEVPTSLASIRWFGYSPWTPEFRKRKTQIDDRRSEFDRANRFGIQHQISEPELECRRQTFVKIGYDVSSRQPKKRPFLGLRRKVLKMAARKLAQL